MKFMIAVDCEGCACVVGEPGVSLSCSANMAFARGQATREANAAARALFDAGAGQVVIWDNHGDGANLHFEQLDSRCEVVLGSGFSRRFPALDESYTGVLMIGYHAMAGAAGVLAHSYSSSAYRAIRVNGVEVGEMALDAAVAGELGVPLIFLSSDDQGCAEARCFMPWVETVTTKQALGHNRAFGKHPDTVVADILAGVDRAVKTLKVKKPFTFAEPVDIELEYKGFMPFLKARLKRPGWRVSGVNRLTKRLSTMLEWQC